MFIFWKVKMKAINRKILPILFIIVLSSLSLLLFGCTPDVTVEYTLEAGAAFDGSQIGCELTEDFDPALTKTVGEHLLTVIADGKKTGLRLTVVDTTAPKIEVNELHLTVGEGVAWRKAANVSDNSDGSVSLSVDSSGVDLSKEGVYTASYTATDASGNSTTVEVKVYVTRLTVTEEMLAEELDRIIGEIINNGMTNEQKCRAVYAYLEENFSYKPAEKSTDPLYSAYLALTTDRGGDCFSYYSTAKAFFDRLGIENLPLTRTEGYVEGSHFWNFVNLGTIEAPLWYHFDASPILGEFSASGCLLTDAQLEAYDLWRGEKYRIYDSSATPKSASEIITEIPQITEFLK